MVMSFHSGGAGARPTLDGLSATPFPSGVKNVPIEVTVGDRVDGGAEESLHEQRGAPVPERQGEVVLVAVVDAGRAEALRPVHRRRER